jgi:quinoprotein glucose dehydrogenase
MPTSFAQFLHSSAGLPASPAHRRVPLLPKAALVVGCAAFLIAATGQSGGYNTWRQPIGGSSDSSNYSELAQITPANVSRLQVAWTYPINDQQTWKGSPIVIGTTIYGFAHNDQIVALDAATGRELWRNTAPPRTTNMRGFNYWESEDGTQKRLLLVGGTSLFAVDATNGRLVSEFGDRGVVDLRQNLDRDPQTVNQIGSKGSGRVFENLLILGSAPGEGYGAFPGDIRAFDIRTGELAWTFHTVPRPGEFGYESYPPEAYKYAGGNNNWGDMSLDEQRGIVYIPTGAPSMDWYGADRAGNNLFGNSILALNARTGERIWHFQTIHHDLWDWDLVAAPQLVTIRREGRPIDAVAQAGKNGFLYVFDRVTGEPVWPIEERPVPRSNVPGEHASPTQPFPTAPPAFARQSFTEADINPHLLPEEQEMFRQLLRTSRNEGMFTPPEMGRFSVQMPGRSGGAALGGASANPKSGLVYIVSFDAPAFLRLERTPEAAAAAGTWLGPQISEAIGCEQALCRPEPGQPPRRFGGGGGAGAAAQNPAVAQGRQIYAQNCVACHGANREGEGAPALIGVSQRLADQSILQIIEHGQGQMPAFGTVLDAGQRAAVLAFLKTGAEGPRAPAPVSVYPTEFTRLFQAAAFAPAAIKPPWSSLTAYDLNTGTIKWQIPYGSAVGFEPADNDFGLLQFHSPKAPVVVTSTGLLFSATTDKMLRAYDAQSGRVIWTDRLPDRAMGNPAMYTVGGRQFLLVVSRGAYVAYALPGR